MRVVTSTLIILNCVVFIYELTLGAAGGEAFLLSFAFIPKHLFYPDAVMGGTIPVAATLFTSMFLHGGWLHIAGNMLYLCLRP